MRAFTLEPSVAQFFSALLASVNGDQGVPTAPSPPADPESAAFLRVVCLPLQAAVSEAASAYGTYTGYGAVREMLAAQARAADPYALDPVTGQPLYPESWGTQAGSP